MAKDKISLMKLQKCLDAGDMPTLTQEMVCELIEGLASKKAQKTKVSQLLTEMVEKLQAKDVSEAAKSNINHNLGLFMTEVQKICPEMHTELLQQSVQSSATANPSESLKHVFAAFTSQENLKHALEVMNKTGLFVKDKLKGTYADPNVWVDKTRVFFKEPDQSGHTGWDNLKTTLSKGNSQMKSLLSKMSENLHHKHANKSKCSDESVSSHKK